LRRVLKAVSLEMILSSDLAAWACLLASYRSTAFNYRHSDEVAERAKGKNPNEK